MSKNDKKSLVVEYAWLEKFGGIGLLQVVKQVEHGEEDVFEASNGVKICCENRPEINGDFFYIRGRRTEHDLDILVIKDFVQLSRIVDAVEEYNAAHAVPVDYLSLHNKLWMKLAETGCREKNSIAESLAREAGVNYPKSGCFLCEEAATDGSGCGSCKGYWGASDITCLNDASYYQMWSHEQDIDLRKALAKRIANNLKTDVVLAHELEIAFTEGKIEAIKKYKARTGRGLRESKDAIEFAMVNGR